MQPTAILLNLPPSIAREIIQTLGTLFPPPVTDSADERAARIETAVATLAAYHPGDASEAQLAAQIVAADAHAKDCLRLAVQSDQDPDTTRRCRAQATAMMRLMQSGLRALQRTQALRQQAEAAMHPAAMDSAGWWFRDTSVPAAEPAPARAAPPEPVATAPDTPPARVVRAEPATAALTDAEHYAQIYPARAALIRARGGLPDRLDFGPPGPAIVAALVNGAGPHTARDSQSSQPPRSHRGVMMDGWSLVLPA